VAPSPEVEAALRDRMAAAARYRRTQGHEVWMVLRYVGERNVSRRRVRPSSWLKYTKSDRWVSHVVRECSCPRAGSSRFEEDGELDESRDDGLREDSMASLRVSSSLSAASHRPVRISEASLLQCA
jgi:hypothetical protein